MKKLFSTLLAFSLLTASTAIGESDSDYQRRLIRERQKEFKSREALKQKQDELKEVDYDKIDKANLKLRKEQQARLDRLQKKFDQVVFQELKRARRFYDNSTVVILNDEAQKRYTQDPSWFNTKARTYIHLFNAEYLQYRYNYTKIMYERPKIEKQRQDQGEIGITLTEKLLEKDPADPELWRIKAIFLSCFKEKRFSKKRYYLEAEATFKKAIELSPDPTTVKISLAQFYMNQPKKYGRNPEAAKLLAEEVLKDHPKSVEALLILGRFYQENFKYKEAHDMLKRANLLEPQNPEVSQLYAIARQDKKRFKKLMEH